MIDAPALIPDPRLELFRILADIVQQSRHVPELVGAELRGTCCCQLGHGPGMTAHGLPLVRRRTRDGVRVYR